MLARVRQVVPGSTATLSIGVSGPAPAPDASALLHVADRALYEAKRLGKDRFVVHPFEPATDDEN
jgi:PleD family two-component response regulator